MEERLNAIIRRIDASHLAEEDKLKLYGIISEGLKASIWPTLLAAMPQEKRDELTKQPGKVSVQAYMSLIDEATADGKALDKIDTTMQKLLDEVEAVLTEEHI